MKIASAYCTAIFNSKYSSAVRKLVLSKHKENLSEKLFSKLCAKRYLKGFVFHSPRYDDPTEKEAGDVVLWLRNTLIVFEVVWRDPSLKGSTKQFVKRIGEKRKQLCADFNAYSSKGSKISLTNEDGNKISFREDCFISSNFVGVILFDCESSLEKVHYESYNKTLKMGFPVCVITKNDFIDLLIEIDTVSDLSYYMKDRHDFVKKIYRNCPELFIDLNRRTERDLIALYKRKENSFEGYSCNNLSASNIWKSYREDYREKIINRDEENSRTKITDLLTDHLLKNSKNDDLTLEFSWEIGIRTRRERVPLADKITSSLVGLKDGVEKRQFAYFSQATGCWSVFYFQHGGQDSFKDNLFEITQLKLFKEMKEEKFQYSVFGYGFFRSSESHKEDYFNEIALSVEDASEYLYISDKNYKKSLKYFGKPHLRTIEEFPEK